MSASASEDKHCKLCEEPIPQKTIYNLNRIAVKEGYCTWSCLIAHMKPSQVSALIKRERRSR